MLLDRSLFIILMLILSLGKAFLYSGDFGFWLQYVGLITLILCLILLLGDLINLVKMPPSVRNGIMASFVLGVLGGASAYIKQTWDSTSIKLLYIDPKMLDEGRFQKAGTTYCPDLLQGRGDNYYKVTPEGFLKIAFAIIVRNYQKDSQGRPNISATAVFTTRDGLSDVGELPDTQSVDAWRDRPMARLAPI